MKQCKLITYLLLLSAFFVGCSDDDEETIRPEEEEIIEQVYQDVVPEEFLNLIVETCEGTQILEGNNPPDLNNKEIITDNFYYCGNVDGDAYDFGFQFIESRISISNFNPDTYQCTLTVTTGSTNSNSEVAYLLGDGNSFTLYAKMNLVNSYDETADFLYLYSGEVTSTGVKDFRGFVQSVRIDEDANFLEPGKFRATLHDYENNEDSIAEFE